MNKKKILIALIAIGILSTVWLITNPPNRFGWSCYAYSTYSALPRIISDYQVRSDGELRKVEKTHELTYDRIQWLLDPKPEVLIIAIGWNGVTVPDEQIRKIADCEVHILKNEEAIELYNQLKGSGKRVAIHYHSTC